MVDDEVRIGGWTIEINRYSMDRRSRRQWAFKHSGKLCWYSESERPNARFYFLAPSKTWSDNGISELHTPIPKPESIPVDVVEQFIETLLKGRENA